MENSSPKKLSLKVRADAKRAGTFELKGTNGRSLGFVMNGDGHGPSFVIAGFGAATRSVYQVVLMWPASKVIHGRLALILLDKIEGNQEAAVLQEVTELLSPVTDSLVLPPIEAEQSDASTVALQTIENFCNKHGLLSEKASRPDCASL